MTTHAPHQDEYVLVRDEREAERLRFQSRWLGEPTAQVLDEIGVKPGMTCLDVGTGPGEVMIELGRRVGPAGRVTGLELDEQFGKRALERARSTVNSRFDLITGDLYDATPGGPFDVVAARLVLHHLRDRATALERLWSWTAPGGALALIEYDVSVIHVTPPLEPVQRLIDYFRRAMEAAGAEHRIATALPAAFERTGIGTPDNLITKAMIWRTDEMASFLAATWRGVAPAVIRMGEIDDTGADALEQELVDCANRERAYMLAPLVVACWKRRPV